VSNVSKGHDFEREIRKLFVDAGWGCCRVASSGWVRKGSDIPSMDLIAYKPMKNDLPCVIEIFTQEGYTLKPSRSTKIPLLWVYSKQTGVNYKKIYMDLVGDPEVDDWLVVFMQCKINKRKRGKAK
jgi:Holliday junction resolvase